MRYARIAILVALLAASCTEDEPAAPMKTIGPFPEATWVLVFPEGNWAALTITEYEHSASGTIATSNLSFPVTGTVGVYSTELRPDCGRHFALQHGIPLLEILLQPSKSNEDTEGTLFTAASSFSRLDRSPASRPTEQGLQSFHALRWRPDLTVSVPDTRSVSGNWASENKGKRGEAFAISQLGHHFIAGGKCGLTVGTLRGNSAFMVLDARISDNLICWKADATLNDSLTSLSGFFTCWPSGISLFGNYSEPMTPFTWVRVD